MENQHLSLTNVSSYLPSPADLLLVFPRLLSKAGSVAEHFGMVRTGSSIAEPTLWNATNTTFATTSGTFVQESVAAAVNAATGSQEDSMFQALKNVGSFFSYITSKWAIATFTIAILLNRTHFYASSRVPLSFDRLYLRLALYILPTMLFVFRIQSLLQALRCQTSPDWAGMQYGSQGKPLDTDFAGEGGLMWRASSFILFWEDTATSCAAVNMLPTDPSLTRPAGSLALLWPLFLSLGFSQFVETLSCALQGRQPQHEAGMTIFEHSLAFAEAEAVVTRPLTLDASKFWKPKGVFTPDGTSLSISRTALSQFVNVPPEVLLISLISSFSHFTSNVLAILGIRSKYRLITTGIWGLSYMSAFIWSFVRLTTSMSDSVPQIGILRVPTVCIVGFIPHLLILFGIIACGAIYSLALALTVLSPPPGQTDSMSWRERFAIARGNLHANIQFSAITPLTVNWHEDFYTTILKIGFTVLTAASEAVYLNEGLRINVEPMTWLEKKRLQELISKRRRFQQTLTPIPQELLSGSAGMGSGIEAEDQINPEASGGLSASGYARERKTRRATSSDASKAVGRDTGVGIAQRRGRWNLSYQFLKGICRLLLAVQARLIIGALQKLRISYRPQWLRRLAGPQATDKSPADPSTSVQARLSAERPGMFADKKRRMPVVDFDLEEFARERLRKHGSYEAQGSPDSEEYLSDYLYGWWKKGKKFGDIDNSGDYVPPDDEDDLASIATTTAEDDWSDIDEGQRTPTQPTWSFSGIRETTPTPEATHPDFQDTIDIARLAHLLNPQTKEDREEARLLARRLQSPGIMTRSQMRRAQESEEARILASSRYPITVPASLHLSPEEEETMLEDFVLDRRHAIPHTTPATSGGTWDTGAEGMGSEGPQCVVCQLSPRTVLVWPCGCLSLCDECRVGLASKNYTNCVCCRTNVVAFSRLFVP